MEWPATLTTQPSGGFHGIRKGPQYLLPEGLDGVFRLFADGSPGHGRLISVQETGIEQPFGHEGRSACRVQIRSGDAAAGL